MTLSIEKLQQFTRSNGFQIQRIFTRNGQCFLVEVMSIHTVDYILIHMPEKYRFNISSSSTPTHDMQIVNFDEKTSSDDIDDYAHVSEALIESSYSDMESIVIPTMRKNKLAMSDHLNESYKRNIILKDLEGADSIIVKDIYRQLRRLKYCIQGMSHKLAVMTAPYIGVLDHDDTITIYNADTLKRSKKHKLYIVVDFKMFYDKVNTIEQECSQILDGIYMVLNNNQQLHSKNIKNLMARRDNILSQSDFLQKCKRDFTDFITKYTDLLNELYSYEKSKAYELEQLRSVETNTMHHDMKRTHQKKTLEKDLQKMQKTKQELVQAIQDVKNKNDNLALSIDTILFDNIVMLDKIFKNFEELEKLENSMKM